MYRSRTTIEEGNGTHNEDQKRESSYKAGCLQITLGPKNNKCAVNFLDFDFDLKIR